MNLTTKLNLFFKHKTRDKLIGIVFATFTVFFYVLCEICTQKLSVEFGQFAINFLRYLPLFLISALLLAWQKNWTGRENCPILILAGLITTISNIFYFEAISKLPLTGAVGLNSLALIVSIIVYDRVVEHQPIGLFKVLSTAPSICGLLFVCLIANLFLPYNHNAVLGYLYALVSGVLGAAYVIVLKGTYHDHAVNVVVFGVSLVAVVLNTPAMLLENSDWPKMDAIDAFYLAGHIIGYVGGIFCFYFALHFQTRVVISVILSMGAIPAAVSQYTILYEEVPFADNVFSIIGVFLIAVGIPLVAIYDFIMEN